MCILITTISAFKHVLTLASHYQSICIVYVNMGFINWSIYIKACYQCHTISCRHIWKQLLSLPDLRIEYMERFLHCQRQFTRQSKWKSSKYFIPYVPLISGYWPSLVHYTWGRSNIDAIFQTMFSSQFCEWIFLNFIQLIWNLFPGV